MAYAPWPPISEENTASESHAGRAHPDQVALRADQGAALAVGEQGVVAQHPGGKFTDTLRPTPPRSDHALAVRQYPAQRQISGTGTGTGTGTVASLPAPGAGAGGTCARCGLRLSGASVGRPAAQRRRLGRARAFR